MLFQMQESKLVFQTKHKTGGRFAGIKRRLPSCAILPNSANWDSLIKDIFSLKIYRISINRDCKSMIICRTISSFQFKGDCTISKICKVWFICQLGMSTTLLKITFTIKECNITCPTGIVLKKHCTNTITCIVWNHNTFLIYPFFFCDTGKHKACLGMI